MPPIDPPRQRNGFMRRCVRTLLPRFRRDERGVTAIEFGLVAMPFLALLFAIIETALVLWTTQVLETAVSDASRKLYTGQFQQSVTQARAAAAAEGKPSPDPIAMFKTELCKSVVALFSCTQVKLDVRRFDANNRPSAPITDDGEFDTANFGAYVPPGPNEIIVVRAAVETPVLVSLLNPNQANLKNGKRLVMGTATFKTEPF
jgi:pilus assembly protein Flp/PilA